MVICVTFAYLLTTRVLLDGLYGGGDITAAFIAFTGFLTFFLPPVVKSSHS